MMTNQKNKEVAQTVAHGRVEYPRPLSLWRSNRLTLLLLLAGVPAAAGPLDAARSVLGVEPAKVAAQAAGAAVANAQDCDPASAAKTAETARALGRVAAAGGKLKGFLGGRKNAQTTADVVASIDCAPAAAQVDGRAEESLAQVVPAVPAAKPATTPRRSTGQRNCGALGAGCADGMQPLVTCMAEKSFWGEMASAVEQKRDGTSGLSAQQVSEMDADIAAMRAAHAAGSGQVQPVDPSRPNRHTDWLTPEEYSQAATRASATLTAHRQSCNDRHVRF
jgi:uncharacterized protein YdbL (DUF1318 family)